MVVTIFFVCYATILHIVRQASAGYSHGTRCILCVGTYYMCARVDTGHAQSIHSQRTEHNYNHLVCGWGAGSSAPAKRTPHSVCRVLYFNMD